MGPSLHPHHLSQRVKTSFLGPPALTGSEKDHECSSRPQPQTQSHSQSCVKKTPQLGRRFEKRVAFFVLYRLVMSRMTRKRKKTRREIMRRMKTTTTTTTMTKRQRLVTVGACCLHLLSRTIELALWGLEVLRWKSLHRDGM